LVKAIFPRLLIHIKIRGDVLPTGSHLASNGIVNLSALAEKEPRTPGQAAFTSHVMSSQML